MLSSKCVNLNGIFECCSNEKERNNSVLRDVTFYGRVRSLIERPSVCISADVTVNQPNYRFVLVDIVAFDLSAYSATLRKNNVIGKDSDCLFLPDRSLSVASYIHTMYDIGSWVELTGNVYRSGKTNVVYGLYKFKKCEPLQFFANQPNTQRKFGLHTKKAIDTKMQYVLLPPSVRAITVNNLTDTIVQNQSVYETVIKSIKADTVLSVYDSDMQDEYVLPPHVNLSNPIGEVLGSFCKSDSKDTFSTDEAKKITDTYAHFAAVLEPNNVSICAGQHIEIASVTLPTDVSLFKSEDTRTAQLQGICKKSLDKRLAFIDLLKDEYALNKNSRNKYFLQFVNSVKRCWNLIGRGIHTDRHRAYTFYKHYINLVASDADEIYCGVPVREYVWSIFPRVIDYALYHSDISDVADGFCLEFIDKYFGSLEFFYAFSLAYILGIDTTLMMYIVNCCGLYGLSFSLMCNTDPYAFMVFTQRFNFRIAERVAYALGVIGSNTDCRTHRNIGLLMQTLCEDLSFSYGSDSVAVDEFCKSHFRLQLKSKEYQRMKQAKVYLSSLDYNSLVYYFGVQDKATIWDVYSQLNWKEMFDGDKSVYVTDIPFTEDEFYESYRKGIDMGLFVEQSNKGTTYTAPAWVTERLCCVRNILGIGDKLCL